MRIIQLAAAFFSFGLVSCQPKEPEEPPREAADLNYTMLGIWPERYEAYEISMALKEAGIQCQLSGRGPCLINVETSKYLEAINIVSTNPKWADPGSF